MKHFGQTTNEAMLREARRGFRFVILAALLSVTSGCGTGGQMSLATPGSNFGPTVAFESVDGPPPQVFDRLVRALETESTAKSFTIVSREAPAAYRIRSYLSAQVRRNKTTIAWVWDVYDRDQQRALRLSGEEPGGKAGRDAWATADDQLIRRIAIAGLNGVSSMISGTDSPAPTTTPETPRTGPAVASSGENPPESALIQQTSIAFSAH